MPTYFDFMITLNRIKPPIWRRFLLHKAATFRELAMAIQESFGWENCHLFEFSTVGHRSVQIAGSPQHETDAFGNARPNAAKIKIMVYFYGDNLRCQYIYDFGDSWHHEVKVKRMVEDEETFKRRLVGGARACPPEDCGGIDGYERFVQIVKTGQDSYEEDVEELNAWLGGWEPEAFDLEGTKQRFDVKARKRTSRNAKVWVLTKPRGN
jgi:hypothetical protein